MRVGVRVCSFILASLLFFPKFGEEVRQDDSGPAISGPPSVRLDEALRQFDSERARELVLDDQDGAEQLFLDYLGGIIFSDGAKEGEPRRLERARRLADVLFRIYEYDFERGIVAYWEKAGLAERQEVLPILRDHYAAYREARQLNRQMPPPIDISIRFRDRSLALADRYRKISFGKGELQAMLWASSLDTGYAWRTWQLAKSLGDDAGRAWAAYYFGTWSGEGQAEFAAQHAVELAERLNLPRLLQFALARQAWRALSHDNFESHIGYLRRALEVLRTIPVRQAMVSRSGRHFYPGEAWYLKTLWRAYILRDRPGGRELFDQGRALSRQHGGDVGELAYLIGSMLEFLRPGLLNDVAAQAETLARRMGDPGWLAAFLMTKAGGLIGTREFREAVAALDEAARIYRAMGDRGHYAECLAQRASFRIHANDLDGAVADYENALRIYDELGLTEFGIGLRTGAGVSLQSQPKLALKFLNQALAKAEAANAPGFIRGAYSGRGKVLAADSPAQSLEDFKKELYYCERHRENIGYPGEVPVAMRLVSQALRRIGAYCEAAELEERRAEFSRKEGLLDAEADAYYELSNIYSRDLGEPGPAADYVERYIRLLDRPGRRLTVNNCDRIAGAYLSIGQPGRALEFWSKALQRAEDMPAGEYYRRMLHFNRAGTYLDLGDYGAALSEIGQEGALIERTFQAYYVTFYRTITDTDEYQATVSEIASSDGHSQRQFQSYEDPIELQKAEWLNKLALAHALSGDLARAVEESRRAIALEFSRPRGTALADYCAYFTPGDALAQAGELDEAIEFHKRRRDCARDIRSPAKERESLVRLGSTYARAGRLEDARKSLLEAIRIDRQPPGPQVGSLSESLLALGTLELQAGDLTRAEALLSEARSTANPYDLNQIWEVERALAAVHAARKKHDLAEAHFELALSALEGGRARLRQEEFALRFGTDRLQIYDDYASYLAGRAIETGKRADSEKAMFVVERRRAQALRDLMALGWAGLPPDAVPEQLRRARQAEARLAAKQTILRDQFGLPPEQRQPGLISQLEAELKTVKEEHARLLTALAQGRFRFSSPSSLPPGLIADVRRALGPDRVLVEYLVTDESTFAFVLSSAGLELSRLPAGRRMLREQVRRLLEPFYLLRSGEFDLARLGFDFPKARALYAELVEPLERLRRVGKASQILVVPDDVLCYLPLELLVDTLPSARRPGEVLYAECERAGFLVRRYTISYLTAAAQVLGRPKDSGEKPETLALLAVANPTGGQGRAIPGQEDSARRRLHAVSSSGAFGSLPGSTDEVALSRRFFPAKEVTVLTGPDATEASYIALSPRSAIVHLATHAVAADDQPFYSTLLLAPDGQGQDDGFLQAYEIVRSPLQARLVVLSACETAQGPLSRGEGLTGLVSAFLQAGARSVLATQWTIDESAAQLMAAFYKAMTGGTDPAAALRQAKLDVLKKRLRFAGAEVSLAHPFFWAPFVLIGTAS